MIYNMNHTSCDDEFMRFGSETGLKEYLNKYNLDGIEYMSFGEKNPRYSKSIIKGVHLNIPNSWLDIWNGNTKGMLDEYGSIDVVKQCVGGDTKEFLIEDLVRQLNFAKECEALYVVFHVTNIKMKESVTWDYAYTDEEVVLAASEWINEAVSRVDIEYDFLLENLWWPGFKMTSPKITGLMLDKINYPKKGIMLDTGHLLHTNLILEDENQGMEYINKCLDEHGKLCNFIKGIHLNQSITGEDMYKLHNLKPDWSASYYEISNTIWNYIFMIDRHKPYLNEGVRKLIDRISPEYVTLEFISRNLKEHEEMIKEQLKWL